MNDKIKISIENLKSAYKKLEDRNLMGHTYKSELSKVICPRFFAHYNKSMAIF